jgi:hypothetical protein
LFDFSPRRSSHVFPDTMRRRTRTARRCPAETLSELRMEIAGTDSHDFRVRLHEREDMLKELLKRVAVEVEIENL